MTSSASESTTDEQAGNSVYKYYDSHKILIYVGITKQGMGRNRQHNADKVWWPFVAQQEIEHLESRDAAAAREIELIRRHRPPFNVQHNPEHAELRQVYVALQQSGRLEMDIKDGLKTKARKTLALHLVKAEMVEWKDQPFVLAEFLTYLEDASIVRCLKHRQGVCLLATVKMSGW